MKKVIILLVTAFLLLFSQKTQAQEASRIGFSVENDSVTVLIFSLAEDEKVFYTINPKDSLSEPLESARIELQGEQTFLIPPVAHQVPHTLYIYIERDDGLVTEQKSVDILQL